LTDETADRARSALPEWLVEIGRNAVRAAYGSHAAESWCPDTARFDLRDADSADLDRLQPHFESTPGQPIVTFHVGDTVVRRVSLPGHPTHAAVELVLRTGDALVALIQSRNAITAAHPGAADPSVGLVCQHLTVTIWTSG
jgi:alkylated DNA repair protein (DNA oxidative demethylase)